MGTGLSKSRLHSYRQCPRRLWLEVHRPELRQFSAAAQFGFLTGNDAGEVARRLHPGGLLIAPDNNLQQALAETREALGSPPRTLFEATFERSGLLVRTDVLEPESGAWHLKEVKASTEVKAYHLDDATIQRAVLEENGIQLSRVSLMHLNNQFVYQGNEQFDGLFTSVDVSGDTRERRDQVPGWVEGAKRTLEQPEPQIAMGDHCNTPFACPLQSHCRSLEGEVEYPVTLLPRPAGKKVARALASSGISDLRSAPLSATAHSEELARIHDSTVSGRVFHDARAAAELSALPYPRAWLDFETIAFAVPRWAGTRPYQAVPFQFSCHIETRHGIQHHQFLELSGIDPRRGIAEALLRDLAASEVVIAYNASFEMARIKELAEAFPDLRGALLAVAERVWDLLPLVKRYYYHPAMKGSRSMKAVLPAVLGYDPYASLEDVKEGGSAQLAFSEAIAPGTTASRRAEIADALSRSRFQFRFDPERRRRGYGPGSRRLKEG
jgi:hypothetical protein